MLIVTNPHDRTDDAVHCTCGGVVYWAGMDAQNVYVTCDGCHDVGTWVNGTFWP